MIYGSNTRFFTKDLLIFMSVMRNLYATGLKLKATTGYAITCRKISSLIITKSKFEVSDWLLWETGPKRLRNSGLE